MHQCINDQLLVRLAAGLVPHADAERVVAEVESCELCRALLIEAGLAVAQSGPNSDAVFRVGEVILERYEVRSLIGRGGMGEVFEVFDHELQERIALKTIRPELSADASVVSRFKQELRLARRVVHRNVCRVFDFGLVRSLADGIIHFYTMELISGQPLSEFRHGREATFGSKVNIACQMARALEAIHALGIVHRDFKPENVMICPTSGTFPRVVLLDFGIARAPDRIAGLKTTGVGVRLGTPDYMAPEVLGANLPSPASDVYSYGLTLHELMTGRHPCPNGGTRMVLGALGELQIPRVDVVRPDIPWQIADLVSACLAPVPAHRPADGGELVRRIDEWGLFDSDTAY
jgi:eukaryotic-like serine/threonine-protein kinase